MTSTRAPMGRRSYRAPGPEAAARRWLTSAPVATSTKGPGGAPEGQVGAGGPRRRKVGRYKTAEESGRYTPPIPKSVRQQPAVVRGLSS